MTTEDLVCITLDIGEQMLISGAEVSRVEDSIRRILTTYDVKRVDVFTITSSIVTTVTDKDNKVITQTRRIQNYRTDFNKLHNLNALSRKICTTKPQLSEIKKELGSIVAQQPFSFAVQCFAFMLIGASFTLFFGGTFLDAAVSSLVALLLKLTVQILTQMNINTVLTNLVGSFLISFLAILATWMHFGNNPDMIIIGNIMLLIPGIGITNSIRDVVGGDLIAGILRFCESIVIALAIAGGYFLAVLVLGGLTA